jgi:hypothetical protein
VGRPEALLQKRVMTAIGSLPGVIAYENRVARRPDPDRPGSFMSIGLGPGTPDVVGAVDGLMFGLELKTPVGALSDVQKDVHAAWRAVGIYVRVVRSPEEAVEAIEECRARGQGRAA